MDRAALLELFDYTGWAWARIARTIDGLPPEQFAAPVAGSGWPSLAACTEHFTASYDGWLNHKDWGLGLGPLLYPGDGQALQQWPTMKEYREQVREVCRKALARDDGWLLKKFERDYGGGPELLSPVDIIANLLLHERGHHGDLNTLFHQLGVRSYIIDYRYFVSRRDEFAMDDAGGD